MPLSTARQVSGSRGELMRKTMDHDDGLFYYPSRYDPPLGHAGFEARLSDKPSERYFDACRVVFPVEQAGALRRLVVEHPSRLPGPLRFTAGRIRLEAHDGDLMEIMTFGGEAAFAEEGQLTICRATSPAPFLLLDDDPNSPFALLEGEWEAVLAQSRAAWGRDEYLHLDRLGQLDPMTLFAASILTLQDRLERLARVEDDAPTRRTLHLVRQFHEQLARMGEWPATGQKLQDLL
jgi:hypothetical protein